MATLYEKHNTGYDSLNQAGAQYWLCQTFTPSEAHTITHVKLLLFGDGSVGTITISIRATSGGEPTGGDLDSVTGTTDGDTLDPDPGEWRQINLSAGISLEASTCYAIVLRCATTLLSWQMDTSAGYAGGGGGTSDDSGDSWIITATNDYMFEDWGNPPVSAPRQSASMAAKLMSRGML